MSATDIDKTTNLQYTDPKTFVQACHMYPVWQKKWHSTILKKFGNIFKHKVYERVARYKVPKYCRIVKSKCVFKVKRCGRFRAWLVAYGYSQVYGIDFVEKKSPIINDITLKLLLTTLMVDGLNPKITDI